MPSDSGHPTPPLSRRAIVQAGLAFGLLGLAGCKGAGESSAGLPGPTSPVGPAPLPPTRLPVPPALPAPLAGTSPIQPRASWTKVLGPARSNIRPMNGVNRITVHHEGATVFESADAATVSRRIESIRLSHISRKTKGENWADIGYHYIIDPGGRIWEGRNIAYQGAHVEDFNEHNVGIMCLGNFDRQTPSGPQLAALQHFLAEQMTRYAIPVSRVKTHRECPGASTRCPGENLQRTMLAYRARGGILA